MAAAVAGSRLRAWFPLQDFAVAEELPIVGGVNRREDEVKQRDRRLGGGRGAADIPPLARRWGVHHPGANRGQQDAAVGVLGVALVSQRANRTDLADLGRDVDETGP